MAPGVRTGEPAPAGTYPPELGTPTVIRPERIMKWLVEVVYPGGLGGRSVLDCACNAGGHLFAAAALGAGRGFGFDVRRHWIEQARFLARHLPSDGLEFAALDLASLPDLGLEPFDVTLFSGILYHLPDPVAGLRIAADHTREMLVVNTSTRPAGGGDALVLTRESETEVMSGVHVLAWLPKSEGVVREMLRWCGFPHARLAFDRPVGGGRRRIILIAARDESTLSHYDTLCPAAEPAPRRGRLRRLLRRG